MAPLRRDGLVELSAGEDRRTRLIALTPQGRERLEAAREAVKLVIEVDDFAPEDLSPLAKKADADQPAAEPA